MNAKSQGADQKNGGAQPAPAAQPDPIIFSLVVIVEGANHTLHYRKRENADAALKGIRDGLGRTDFLEIHDEFGTAAVFRPNKITSAQITDVVGELKASEEVAILKALSQISVNDRGMAHPRLKLARVQGGQGRPPFLMPPS